MKKNKRKRTTIGELTRRAQMARMNPQGFRRPPKNRKSRKRKQTMIEDVDRDIADYERKM